jgi:hypothetical protein
MWVFLQYLLGFRRLGYDVLYLDALEPESYVDEKGRSCPLEESWSLRYVRQVMATFALQNNYSILCDGGTRHIGLSRENVIDRVRHAECLINVMGFLRDEEILAAARRRIFLDIDPGFGQMWRELGLADIFAGHDAYVTVGANVGRSECTVPTCGLTWIPTVPPVVLERWPMTVPQDAGKFTSVITWRGIFGPIEFQGTTYGLRVHEFRKFIELPHRSAHPFELALDIHETETADLAALTQNDWKLVDPALVTRSPHDYQRYIRTSKAEFGVAKNMYVKTRGGWISDRSVCYLASGKPVLIQDTGIREGIESIGRNYEAHCQAARRLAEQKFDSDKVLPRLLMNLGIE